MGALSVSWLFSLISLIYNYVMNVLLTGDTHQGWSHNTHIILRKFWERHQRGDFSAIIHVGDWATYTFRQNEKSFRLIRQMFPAIPIMTVLGNHDFWKRKGDEADFDEIMDMNRMWMFDNGIHYLSDEPCVMGNIVFLGFDGWYFQGSSVTKDEMRMPIFNEGVHSFMSKRAHEGLTKVLETETGGRKVVVVTHFSPVNAYGDNVNSREYLGANPRYVDFIRQKSNLICVGHSHKRYTVMKEHCRIVDSGGSYDKPASMILNLDWLL